MSLSIILNYFICRWMKFLDALQNDSMNNWFGNTIHHNCYCFLINFHIIFVSSLALKLYNLVGVNSPFKLRFEISVWYWYQSMFRLVCCHYWLVSSVRMVGSSYESLQTYIYIVSCVCIDNDSICVWLILSHTSQMYVIMHVSQLVQTSVRETMWTIVWIKKKVDQFCL